MKKDQALPPYPRTPVLPYKPNGATDDVVASDSEAAVVFGSRYLHIEEKLDGANIGIAVIDDHPIIRNRDHFLSKGSSKGQFAPLWGWYYDNRGRFERLSEYGSFSVYGEWLLARHTIPYTRLPDWFVAYDLYDQNVGKFLSPATGRRILQETGFHIPLNIHEGALESHEELVEYYEDLEQMTRLQSAWADSEVEGIYLKVCNHEVVTHRFKMVREDFRRKPMWTEMTRNGLANE